MKAISIISAPDCESSEVVDFHNPTPSASLGELQIRLHDLHGLVCYLLEKNQSLRAALASAGKQLTSSAGPLETLSQTGVTDVAITALIESREVGAQIHDQQGTLWQSVLEKQV